MLDRRVAPPASTIARPNLPSPDRLKIGEIPVTVLDKADQPVILFELVFPLGRWDEPKQGLVFLLFKMMQEGTKKHSAEDIAELLDFHGSFLEISPSLDYVSIKLYTLIRFFPKLIGLLVELLTESIFPEKEFQTLQQIRLEQVKQQQARNDAYANSKFREMLFGADHPYGRINTEELVHQVNRTDVLDFSQRMLPTPQIFLTGMISSTEIDVVKDHFENLPFAQPAINRQIELVTSTNHKEKREESTQASIRLGKLSLNRKHEDIHQFKIANELLGGFFGSRLMKNIREDKGLTYGIHSNLVHLKNESYWVIGSEVLGDKADLAFDEINKEIVRLGEQEPSSEEFAMVINYMKGKFLSSFGSPFNTHEMVKGMTLAEQPNDYFSQFLNALDQTKPSDICEMISKHIDPISLTTLEVC